MTSARAVYDEAIRRYNEGDVDGFVDLHAIDAVLVTPATTVRGRSAIRDHWLREQSSYPDRRLAVGEVVAQGELIACEWTWSGTNSGELHFPDGNRRSATGHRLVIRGMELARVHHGEITEYRMYWDGREIARQLGS